MNSLVLIPSFLNHKPYLGQILWYLSANKSLQPHPPAAPAPAPHPPQVVGNKSKTEHLRYKEQNIHHTKP